jgi:hypothetical protein
VTLVFRTQIRPFQPPPHHSIWVQNQESKIRDPQIWGGGERFKRVATRESFFLINEDNSAATRLRVKIEYTTVALIVAYETEWKVNNVLIIRYLGIKFLLRRLMLWHQVPSQLSIIMATPLGPCHLSRSHLDPCVHTSTCPFTPVWGICLETYLILSPLDPPFSSTYSTPKFQAKFPCKIRNFPPREKKFK